MGGQNRPDHPWVVKKVEGIFTGISTKIDHGLPIMVIFLCVIMNQSFQNAFYVVSEG
jgi:hypothetical protein